MSFLNLVRHELCHPEQTLLRPGPVLHCTFCQRDVLDVYDYANRPHADFFRSAELAQAYAAWTGDEGIPTRFPLSHVEGIYDTVVTGQPLARLRKSVRLLRALNAPFTTDSRAVECSEEDTRTFLADFLNILYEHPNVESSDERKALEALMKSMHDILSLQPDAVDPFETYFKVLVPYVLASAENTWRPLPFEPAQSNAARELHFQLIRSHAVRKRLSRFAIPFDVLHVMVCCYACSCDLEVVGNWAIDFLVRICRGEFFWKRGAESPFVKSMQRLVQSEVHYRSKNTAHFYKSVVRPLRHGESIDHYSTMWQPLHQLQAFLKKKFVLPTPAADVLDTAFLHTFPAVLFEDYVDQLGFTMGYNHLVLTVNRRNGSLPKGAFKKARLIHDVVRRFVGQVLQFDGTDPLNPHLNPPDTRPIWNLDMVRLFFASDEHFHQEIMQVIQILVADEDEE